MAWATGVYLLGMSLVVPLLAWGVDDLAGFFSNPARLLLAVGAGLQMLAVGLVGPRLPFAYLPGQQQGRPGRLISRQRIVPLLARVGWLAVFLLAPYGDRRGLGVLARAEVVRWLGLAAYAAGLGVVVWAFLTLGRHHSPDVTVQADHRLVDSGPYRWIRHPMYLGLIVFPAGFALIFRSWLGLLLASLGVGLFAWRMGDEERLLREEFGPAWDDYARRTGRLLPRLVSRGRVQREAERGSHPDERPD